MEVGCKVEGEELRRLGRMLGQGQVGGRVEWQFGGQVCRVRVE